MFHKKIFKLSNEGNFQLYNRCRKPAVHALKETPITFKESQGYRTRLMKGHRELTKEGIVRAVKLPFLESKKLRTASHDNL